MIVRTREPGVEPTVSSARIVADTIVRTVELGHDHRLVSITDAAISGESTVVWCDLRTSGPGRCPACGAVGTYPDRVERRLTDLPVAGHPLQLRVRVPRYRCQQPRCERVVFTHDTSRLARAGATATRRCARYVLRRLVLDRVTVAAVARELGRSWDTVNTIAMAATTQLLATARPCCGRPSGLRERAYRTTREIDTTTAPWRTLEGSWRRGPRRRTFLIPTLRRTVGILSQPFAELSRKTPIRCRRTSGRILQRCWPTLRNRLIAK